MTQLQKVAHLLKHPKLKEFFLSFLFAVALWPDAPWLNRLPQTNATASAVAFISPYDLQFYRVMNTFRKLEKRYGSTQVNFIIVAMGEQGLPMTDEVVRTVLKEYNYTLPVLLDQYSSYAKSRRAYASPTTNLFFKDGRVSTLDPGNFDPALLEKALQKALKESGGALPLREFANDAEFKFCGHTHSIFVGERFGKAWSPETVATEGPWTGHGLWLESDGTAKVQAEFNQLKSSLGVLAESTQNKPIRVNVFLDGAKVPNELKGKDIQEDKNGNTFLVVQSLKMYETISHSTRIKDPGLKFTLSTESKGLRLRALETLPTCLETD